MPQTAFVYRFGAFTLDPATRRLMVGDEYVRLTDSQFSILLRLLSEAPEIVDCNCLAQDGWGGNTSEANVRQAVYRLRKVLTGLGGLDFIETVSNRGYRFVAPFERREPEERHEDLHAGDELLQGFLQGRRDLATLNRDAIIDARRRFERYVESHPDDARAHAGLSQACALIFEATRTDSASDAETLAVALRHARRATMLDPSLPDGRSALGFALALSGDTEAATVAAWKAVTLKGRTLRDWLRLAYVTWGEDRLESAGEALQLRPDLPLAYWLQGTVYVARGAFERALAVLDIGCTEQGRQRNGHTDYPAVGLRLLRGSVYAQQERLDDADEEFAAELANPDRGQLYWRECAANTWYSRGAIYVRRGLVRDATAAFEQALQVEPGHFYSLAALGRQLPALPPHDPRAINLGIARAIALTRAGRHPDAAEVFRAAVAASRLPNAGWLLPIEPILHAYARPEIWGDLLALIRDRAT